jgi:hypothetical protein
MMLAILVSLVSAMPPPDGDELMQLIKTKAVPSWKRMARHDVAGQGGVRHWMPKATNGWNSTTEPLNYWADDDLLGVLSVSRHQPTLPNCRELERRTIITKVERVGGAS